MNDKKKQESSTYDEAFASGGYEGVYDLPYYHSLYYPLYKGVLKAVQKKSVSNILEVGTGTGAFAKFIFDKSGIKYKGFDFSPVAIEKAQQLLGDEKKFYVADATSKDSYPENYEAIVCTEVLEHLEGDLDVIKSWKSGTICFCSVPNYDSEYHERYFTNCEEVKARYSEQIDIDYIVTIKKPVLTNLSFSNRLKQLRWNRYKPSNFVKLLGLVNFEQDGGWFLFVGTKK